MLLRSEMIEVIQVCMSIHSGHPEKYKEVIEILQSDEANTALSEERIEQIKGEEAWMPLTL